MNYVPTIPVKTASLETMKELSNMGVISNQVSYPNKSFSMNSISNVSKIQSVNKPSMTRIIS